MARKAFGLLLSLALSVAWVGPLCAMPMGPTHACCVGGGAPMPAPSNGDVPACCRPADSVPAASTAALLAPVPALLPSGVIVAQPPASGGEATSRSVASAPQAPPGTHSGLSPPSSGL
ncbi:MAG: hypothetical protein HYV14_04815 [Elusimicrobia bacterium]|nr:hypothetical protein [Elusimicrobiota bacterium]